MEVTDIFLLFLYASTFYRFRYFFSYLKKRQPQVVADTAHRCVRGNDLPVLIIFKNADRYPARLLSVEIEVDGKPAIKQTVDQSIREKQYEKILQLPTKHLAQGAHSVNVAIVYECNGRRYRCFNDNYRGTSHAPLPFFISEQPLPRLEGFVSGDCHTHSACTDDQIEFAATLPSSLEMARTVGLSFFAVTDHSYDLDDDPDNFLTNDPQLPKWKQLLQEVNMLNNSNEGFCIIPGEEVSCRAASGKTVHLLVYNSERFFEGSGDSGEKWFRRRSRFSVEEVCAALAPEALAFAAHPEERVPAAQRLLLNRDSWLEQDCRSKGLSGVQIVNGMDESNLRISINFWRDLLLKGLKLPAITGNDGHGNFSRNRSIDIPFIRISETGDHVFGVWRTDVYLGGKALSTGNLTGALRKGCCAVSNGPALELRLFNKGNEFLMGDTAVDPLGYRIKALSTAEFGAFQNARLCIGLEKYEKIIVLPVEQNGSFKLEIEKKLPKLERVKYVRAEVDCAGPRGKRHAFSNPVFVNSNGD